MRLRKKKSLIDQAMDQASDVVDATLPVIESAVAQVREHVREISKDAAEGAKDFAKDTREKAGPLMTEGRALAGEIVEATREVAIPKAKAGAKAGAERAADLASTGRDLAAAKVADIKGEPPKKKSRKFRKVLVLGGLVALGGFLARKLRPQPDADNWQSSYTPPTPATSTTTSATSGTPATSDTSAASDPGGTHLAPGVGPDEPLGADDPMVEKASDDSAGALPGEAISDAVEEPHPVTTPDDPAEVVEVDPTAAAEKKG